MNDRSKPFDAEFESARALIVRECDAEIHRAAPDFLDVLARVRAQAPDTVTDADWESAKSLPPELLVGPSSRPRSADAPADDALGREMQSLFRWARRRATIEAGRRSAPEFAPRIPGVRGWHRAQRGVLAMGLASAAALVFIWMSPRTASSLLARFTDGTWSENPLATYLRSNDEMQGVLHGQSTSRSHGEQAAHAPLEATRVMPQHPSPDDLTMETESESVGDTFDKIDEKVSPHVDALKETQAIEEINAHPNKRTRARSVNRVSKEDRLRELELRAQAAWRSGDRPQAVKHYRAIIAMDKSGRFAELAWGDLFLLAKEKAADALRRDIWRQYLRQFPRGRFADDAQAGLCRTSNKNVDACWERYLRDFSAGAHRDEGERAMLTGTQKRSAGAVERQPR